MVHKKLSPYYPQANGLVESTNKQIMRTLMKLVSNHPRDWDAVLPSALWAYRTTFKVATGLTLFKLAFGMETITPMEYVVPNLQLAIQERLLPEDAIAVLDEDRLKRFYWLQELQQCHKRQKDVFSRAPKFVRGDLVIIFSARMFKKPRKLSVRWSGPFWVYATCGPTSFFLSLICWVKCYILR